MVKELVKEALERFEEAETAWSEDRLRYKSDFEFAGGDQWPDDIKRSRANKRRPCLTVDKLGQYIRQIVNDARQNRPAVNVHPVDDHGDPEVAKIMQGMIRHVEYRSNADIAYDTALECAVTGGFGYFRILTEYAHDATFDQELCVRRIRNPLTVWMDPNCNEPDGSDATYCFVTDDIPKKEYESKYKGTPIDWDSSDVNANAWFGDSVRVAEYWYVEEKDRDLHLLADGTVTDDEEIARAEAEGIQAPQIIDTRKVPKRRVMWCRLNGVDVIEGPMEWPGKWIPIIPVWGNESDIDGKVKHTGLIHPARDAQTLYNFSRTAFAERVALAPKSPYIAASGQIEDYQDEWNSANESNRSVLRYDPIDVAGHMVPAPMRQPASDIPAGFAEDMRLAEHDIQGALGMYESSLGQRSNEVSGRAIRSRQIKADVGTYHYHDNLSRAIRHAGRILVDLIPKIYDTQRVVRVLGQDGTAEQVELDPMQEQGVQKQGAKAIYNPGVGRYDVTISTGPSYMTLREEAADRMGQLIQASPDLMTVFGDLWIKSQDWPGADEMAERMATVLNPAVQQAMSQDKEIPPEAMPIIQSMQQKLQSAEQMFNDMNQQMQELTQENEQLKQGFAIKAQGEETAKFEAETGRITALANAQAKEAEIDLKVREMISARLDELLTTELQRA